MQPSGLSDEQRQKLISNGIDPVKWERANYLIQQKLGTPETKATLDDIYAISAEELYNSRSATSNPLVDFMGGLWNAVPALASGFIGGAPTLAAAGMSLLSDAVPDKYEPAVKELTKLIGIDSTGESYANVAKDINSFFDKFEYKGSEKAQQPLTIKGDKGWFEGANINNVSYTLGNGFGSLAGFVLSGKIFGKLAGTPSAVRAAKAEKLLSAGKINKTQAFLQSSLNELLGGYTYVNQALFEEFSKNDKISKSDAAKLASLSAIPITMAEYFAINRLGKIFTAPVRQTMVKTAVDDAIKTFGKDGITKAMFNDVTDATVKGFGRRLANVVSKGGQGALVEGTEESVQQAIQIGSQQLYDRMSDEPAFNITLGSKDGVKQIIDNGFWGGVIGGIIGAGGGVRSKVYEESVFKYIGSSIEGKRPDKIAALKKYIETQGKNQKLSPLEVKHGIDMIDRMSAIQTEVIPMSIKDQDARWQAYQFIDYRNTVAQKIEELSNPNIDPDLQIANKPEVDKLKEQLAVYNNAIQQIGKTKASIPNAEIVNQLNEIEQKYKQDEKVQDSETDNAETEAETTPEAEEEITIPEEELPKATVRDSQTEIKAEQLFVLKEIQDMDEGELAEQQQMWQTDVSLAEKEIAKLKKSKAKNAQIELQNQEARLQRGQEKLQEIDGRLQQLRGTGETANTGEGNIGEAAGASEETVAADSEDVGAQEGVEDIVGGTLKEGDTAYLYYFSKGEMKELEVELMADGYVKPKVKGGEPTPIEDYGDSFLNDKKIDKEEAFNELQRRQEQSLTQPPAQEALKDVESTAKALEKIARDEKGDLTNIFLDIDRKAWGKRVKVADEELYNKDQTSTIRQLAYDYHKSKKDGSNPELVKAVEELLSQKEDKIATEQTTKTQQDATEKRNITESNQQQYPQAEEVPKDLNDGETVGDEISGNKIPNVNEVLDLIDSEEGSQGYRLYPDKGDKYDESYHRFKNKKEAMAYAQEIYDVISSMPEHIPIYRAVSAKDVDLDPYAIGESWSFDLSSAKEFGSHNGSNKIISGYVENGNVDWDATIRAYHLFSGIGNSDSEFEITVPSGNKITGVKVESIKEAKLRQGQHFFEQPQAETSNSHKPKQGGKGQKEIAISPNKSVKANQKIAAEEIAENRNLHPKDVLVLYSKEVRSLPVVNEAAMTEDERIEFEKEGVKGAMPKEKVPPQIRKRIENLLDEGMLEMDTQRDVFYLTPKGKDVIDAIDARLATRKAVKEGTDMFPAEANIEELQSPASQQQLANKMFANNIDMNKSEDEIIDEMEQKGIIKKECE